MKKLLFYGGTFDPPHSGHLHLLRQTTRQLHFDKIIVMPTAVPPHKEATHFLDDEIRFKAAQMLFSTIRGVCVSDWEIRKGGKSYSIETIEYLLAEYPDHKVYFLMGSDMFLGFEKWYRFEELIKMCTILVAARTKDDISALRPMAKKLEQRYGAECQILKMPIHEKSSTQIRSGAADDKLPLEVRYFLYGSKALESLEQYLRENLTPQKYEHSYRVAEYAVQLARIHGADESQVYLASLLHDATKCWGKARQISYLNKRHYKLSPEDRQAPQIYHQITGALFAGERFYVRDRSILNAIKCHTTGREHMNVLDKILFLADSIEPARSYEGVDLMRQTALTDLDKAVLMNFDRSITYIVEKGFFLHPQTVAARNWMLRPIMTEEKNVRSE